MQALAESLLSAECYHDGAHAAIEAYVESHEYSYKSCKVSATAIAVGDESTAESDAEGNANTDVVPIPHSSGRLHAAGSWLPALMLH
jgi:hypothetical protein